MKPYRLILVLLLTVFIFACSTTPKYKTPFDTLRAYTTAIKKKDITTMKTLLSAATIEMHQQQAQMQNVTLDEIVQRETLFNPNQNVLEYRNEKIDGERATIEVRNSFNTFDTVVFVLEEGIWKIDKAGSANQLQQNIEQQNDQQIDDMINRDRIDPDQVPDPNPTPETNPTPDPNQTPGVNPMPDPNQTPGMSPIPGLSPVP